MGATLIHHSYERLDIWKSFNQHSVQQEIKEMDFLLYLSETHKNTASDSIRRIKNKSILSCHLLK
jgi:hypothetical protein